MRLETALKWGLLAAAAALVIQDRGSRTITDAFFQACDKYRKEDKG